ncbi:Fic family protein [Williamsia sp. D3]|uniref:Fic family protein n=1 Tax=Williamsia TaxID=85043 RepID=UPI0006853D08|nr:Fic family protein [Williamsia sp. D3]
MDWDDYYWPGTTVLANKLGHHNQHDLSGEEYIWTAAREELVRNGTAQIQRTFDAEHLRALHGYLFQDVYEWAGQYREVNMSKDGKPFAHRHDIDHYLAAAATTAAETSWATVDRGEFADQSAVIYTLINHAHPFREGNGRAAKLFMAQIAEQSAYDYNFTAIDPYVWNMRSGMSRPEAGRLHHPARRPDPGARVHHHRTAHPHTRRRNHQPCARAPAPARAELRPTPRTHRLPTTSRAGPLQPAPRHPTPLPRQRPRTSRTPPRHRTLTTGARTPGREGRRSQVDTEPSYAVRYPDLFAGLTIEQKWNVHNNIASHVLDGWTPGRADIADLTALERGDIDGDEYVRRADARLPHA